MVSDAPKTRRLLKTLKIKRRQNRLVGCQMCTKLMTSLISDCLYATYVIKLCTRYTTNQSVLTSLYAINRDVVTAITSYCQGFYKHDTRNRDGCI